MKFQTGAFFNVLSVALILTAVGCSDGQYVPVTGKVTYHGKPLQDVVVVFTPKPKESDQFPGLLSMGVTDKDGQFVLKAKNGSAGAVPGEHAVGVTWKGMSPMEMSHLYDDRLTAEFSEDPEAVRDFTERKIEELKQKKDGKQKLDPNLNITFEVPPEGTNAADFELGPK